MKSDMVNAQFFIEVMPRTIDFNTVQAELLYRHSTQLKHIESDWLKFVRLRNQLDKRAKKEGVQGDALPKLEFYGAPQRFHSLCDNKGATLIFVKASGGYVFGGYNPVGWESDFKYSPTQDAYLFSVTDGRGRQTMRCPIKESQYNFAIK